MNHSSLLLGGGSLTTTPFSRACRSTSARSCLSNCVRCARSPSRRSASMAVTLIRLVFLSEGKRSGVSRNPNEKESPNLSLSWPRFSQGSLPLLLFSYFS